MSIKKYINLFDKNYELNSIETNAGRVTLLTLFLPIFVEQTLKSLMSTVNVYILGNFSDEAVAAVGVATQIVNMQMIIYFVIGIGASIVISQYLGAGDKEQAKKVSGVAVVLVTAIGLVIGSIIAVFAKDLMKIMQLKDNLLSEAVAFLQILSIFSVFQAFINVFSAISSSYGLARIPMITAFIMNLLNAIGSYLVVFRPFEIPLYGVKGVAYCRVISEILALMIMLVIIKKNGLEFDFKCLIPFPKRYVFQILRIGVPSGMDSFNYSISQIITTGIIASLGTAAVAAKVYTTNIVFYVYVFGLSLGQTTSLMIGWLVGAGEFDRAYRLNLRNLKVTVTLNVILSILICILRRPIVGIFTKDENIISLCSVILIIDIFVEIFRGVNHVEQSSLRGAGDVRFPVIVSLCTCWGICILFSYILGIKAGLGLAGCWIAFAMEEAARGCLLFMRWRTKKWMSMAIVTKKKYA